MNQKEYHKHRYEEYKLAYAALMKFYPFTTDDLPNEIWRPIPNYEELYHCSNYGRVKSFYNGKGKILKPALNLQGYLRICLSKDSKSKKFSIHRLVAILFIENPGNKPQVNHKFGIKFDNFVDNLEWATPQENSRHAYDFGLSQAAKGIFDSNSKIKDESIIIYIRSNPDKLTRKQLAEKFGVLEYTISEIQLGKTYQNSGGQIRERCGVSDEEKQKILARYQKGKRGCLALAKEFGYSHRTILNVVHSAE